MRLGITLPALCVLLALSPTADAGGYAPRPGPPPGPVPVVAGHAHAHTHAHGHHQKCPYCGPEVGCAHHPFCRKYPCASYLTYQCDPLPPTTLSRYADNEDYLCTRRCFGDAYPHHPHYWYPGQPYPLPHEHGVQPAVGGGFSGLGRGL